MTDQTNPAGQNPPQQNPAQGGGFIPQQPTPPPNYGAPQQGMPAQQYAPQGGFPPTGGQPMGMGGAYPGAGTPPPPPPEDTTPANYQIGQHIPKVIDVKLPAHQLAFDEQHFLHLLAGSISLTREEKKRIIDSTPRLKQSQVDELIRIFEEERRKFAELSAKHVEQLKKLEKQHWADWQDIELQQKSEQKKAQEANQADEIRKKLGL